ncbi:hypothetical protein GCM10009839_40090 [Catenulispora yoronensis]|uniref:Uncharacterized protein n=1 Tax=Catenulispora yoronensis TaxID=450799 RepID=A0ABN2UEN0_9ACTN
MRITLSPGEVSDFDRQAAMAADLSAFLARHRPGSPTPVPPVPYQINRWAISVRLEPDDVDYIGEDLFGTPCRSRAQVVAAWAAALGVPVVKHRWRDGRLELAVGADIGKPRRDGTPRTAIGIRTMISPGDDGWIPPGQDPTERDLTAAHHA